MGSGLFHQRYQNGYLYCIHRCVLLYVALGKRQKAHDHLQHHLSIEENAEHLKGELDQADR